MSRRVLIIGAGIAGQSMAIALARAGIDFDIVEAKSEFDILGSGMYVQNNALRCFQEIGVAEAIQAAGWISPTGESHLLDEQGGFLTSTRVPPCPGSDLPGYVPISRARLHDILYRAAVTAGAQIRMGATVRALEDDGAGVDATFSDGTQRRYDLVVGADGVNSATRRLLFSGVDPEYSGFSNWRVTLPMPEPMQTVIWQMGDETSFGIIPISSHELYAALVTKEPGNPWFDPETLLEKMRDRCTTYGGPARAVIERIPGPEAIIYTPIKEVILPAPWYRGNVVLVGDAAHASTPFWAQGASMAVEDVILLTRLLAQGRAISDLLAEWQTRRTARCLFVQEGSKRTGVLGHSAGAAAQEQGRAHLRAHAQDDVNRRYDRLNQPI